ncbi:MFS transporter [Leptolyngbya ohadii]|uniref:MFS transporter n=1 Tax=Leptolyngbya ohadii TaxID=1962290 RepID=UPI000B59F74A|nr:MFS transporter [Leptolyngbya ohadii]
MSNHPLTKILCFGSADQRFISALGVAQICSWGSLYYSFPLLAEAMSTEFGWTKTSLYGAATVGLLLSGIAAYPVGAGIDRGYGRRIMSLSSLLAGLLLIAWSQISSLIAFYVIFAGIGCLQAATLYEPAFAVIANQMGGDKARQGITALTLWGGFASTVFIPLTEWLLVHLGWRETLMVLGTVNIAICASLYAAVIQPKLASSPALHLKKSLDLNNRQAVIWAVQHSVFWALLVSFVVYAAVFSAFTFHLYPLLLERGLRSPQVVAVLAVIGPAQVMGRLLMWKLASNASIGRVGSFIVALFPLVFLGIAWLPPTLTVLTSIAVLYGAANGVMTIVRGVAIPEMLTRRSYGTINSAIIAPSLVAKALAPVGVAALWAKTGGYNAVLMALLLGALILAVGFWVAVALRQDTYPDTAQ